MNDKSDIEELFLPEDLKALDEELLSIRYEERPSFAPELRAELARVWAAPVRRGSAAYRYLAAAALAGVLLMGASVPAARASLVRLLVAFGEDPVAEATVETPPPEPVPVQVVEVPEAPEEDAAVETLTLPEEPPVASPVVEADSDRTTVPPQWLDRQRAVLLLEEAYPRYLQREGVGGVVWLRAWVDTNGITGAADVTRGSGVQDLDRAALEVAPLLRFAPAMQGGAPVATWIEFPVLFEPDANDVRPVEPRPTEDPMRLPIVHLDDRWEFEQPLELDELPDWSAESLEVLSEAERALIDAIGDPIVRRSLGPIESILSGVVPEGRDPTEWRAAARAVLEDATQGAVANPAPLLALGRIRLRQGLRNDARMLFEQGLQFAIQAGSAVSPAILAELHYERGLLLQEGWAASRGVGRVHAYAFEAGACAQARSSGGAASGFASVDRLMAWNYLCPRELSSVFERGFEASGEDFVDLSLMMGSLKAAIGAEPGHAGANVEYLVTLAEHGRWDDVLSGGRRFARRSGGHPRALLLIGLALQRLDRPAEADAHFEEALARLPASEVDLIRDVTHMIDRAEFDEYRRLWGEERRAWEEAFWMARDRTPANGVNEREVQHLARSTYAFLRFGGVTSDPGEVWVRFGGPNQVHVVDEGAGQLTEFWDYGSGPDITFVRRVSSQSMDLTPEGRAYVDDLGKIFPPQ